MEQGVLVKDLNLLTNKSLKRKSFYLIDVYGLVPTDILYFILKRYDFWPIVRVNRLVKLDRVWELKKQTETSTNYPYFLG